MEFCIYRPTNYSNKKASEQASKRGRDAICPKAADKSKRAKAADKSKRAKEQKSKRAKEQKEQKSKSLLVCRCQIPPLFCSIRPVGFARIYQKKVVIHKVSLARLLFCFLLFVLLFCFAFCFCQLLLGRWHLSLACSLACSLALLLFVLSRL